MQIQLSRNDTAFLKGVAIVAIVMHNFCHWLPGCVAENEYSFRLENSEKMWDYLLQGGPHLVLNLFSYFGHYGVPVFLFLSGYGLVRKYEASGCPEVAPGRFVRYNALKLWRLMALGVLLLFFSEFYRYHYWRHGWDTLVYYFTFVANLQPHRDLMLGPWWYFSLTMQMYLLYRFVFYRRGRGWLIGAALACIALQVAAVWVCPEPPLDALKYLRYNCMGCLLPFVGGVWAARYGLRLTRTAWAVALFLFWAGCFNLYLWMLTPLWAVLVVLPVVRIRNLALRRTVEWLGAVSAAWFVIHPVVREFWIITARGGRVYEGLFGYLVIGLLVAWGCYLQLRQLPSPRE